MFLFNNGARVLLYWYITFEYNDKAVIFHIKLFNENIYTKRWKVEKLFKHIIYSHIVYIFWYSFVFIQFLKAYDGFQSNTTKIV